MTLEQESLDLHRKLRGKITVKGKAKIKNIKDLSLFYTPGVAEACREIARNSNSVYDLTIKSNSVAIVTDGTRVLGLGNVGPEASLPVMEGKAMIMNQFGNLDAFPICLNCHSVEEIVKTVKNIEPVFGAINLEDIETPKVFEIEEKLINELNIPVFHDDQHGTAMVVLAGLINALKVLGKDKNTVKVGVIGAGSAGYGIVKLLIAYGIKNITCFDSKGSINLSRIDLTHEKTHMAEITKTTFNGKVDDFEGADIIISAANPKALPKITIQKMKKPNIVFALANPTPEISLEEAKALKIDIFGTGRSDYPNQINNSVCFPGFLRALLDLKIKKITDQMKIAASEAIAASVKPTKDKIIPDAFDKKVVKNIKKYIEAILK